MSWDKWNKISEWIYIYSALAGVVLVIRGTLVGFEETGDWLMTSFWGLILVGPMGGLILFYFFLILYLLLGLIVKLIKKIPDKYLG